MSRVALGVVIAAMLVAGGCERERPSAPVAPTQPPDGASTGGVRFVDVAATAGLTAVPASGNLEKNHLLESTGSGVAAGDIDGDGDDDIYLCTEQTTDDWLAGRKPKANALYRNNGDGTFTEIAESAGVALHAWSNGAYFADVDGDGDLDLFVTTWGPNVLYRNDGHGRFTDITRESGVAGAADAWSASAAFGDLDRDGDLDLYVANYCRYDLSHPPLGGQKTMWKGMQIYPGPVGLVGQPDMLYRNDGHGRFADVTRNAGIDDWTHPHYGLGVVMSDLDDDGDLDIFVANDSCGNFLWRNDGGMKFSEIGALAGVETNEDGKQQAGMGTDAADCDGDTKPEIVVTNFSHDWNTLFRNRGKLLFNDGTFPAGFKDSYLDLAWGVRFFDFDDDGVLDLLVANGHIYPDVDGHPELSTTYKQLNRLYHGEGGCVFRDVTGAAGPGLAVRESTRGLALTDFDRDGDLDVVLTNMSAAPTLLRNDGGNVKSWVALRLVGTKSDRAAIGAKVVVESGGAKQFREVNPFGSYESTSTATVHIGLGAATAVDRVTIRWPSGATEALSDLPARHFVTVVEGKGVVETSPRRPEGRP